MLRVDNCQKSSEIGLFYSLIRRNPERLSPKTSSNQVGQPLQKSLDNLSELALKDFDLDNL